MTTNSSSSSTEPESSLRTCRSCKEPLTEARIKAVPRASLCVACLEARGDVLLLKRYDEFVGSVEVQTYYKENAYIEEQTRRRVATIPANPKDELWALQRHTHPT